MKKLCRMTLILAVLFTGLGVGASAPPDACAREPGAGGNDVECPCLPPGGCGYSEVG